MNERRRKQGLGPLPEEPRPYVSPQDPEISLSADGMGTFRRLVNAIGANDFGGK
tara:strand:- start:5900 stop:6061 length:162 start_codon:yes stop_codon:yes gene_type:complete